MSDRLLKINQCGCGLATLRDGRLSKELRTLGDPGWRRDTLGTVDALNASLVCDAGGVPRPMTKDLSIMYPTLPGTTRLYGTRPFMNYDLGLIRVSYVRLLLIRFGLFLIMAHLCSTARLQFQVR
ncbi:hypothetical protein NDU88_008113 [Pleurodeles waltl]|uniref:Uncharacterized protein n=1 Tax=Pleurodeles waltl TaxID=8319 RepID=A0AAV7N634_PLEWA|nr:hypothetical protein NDU88_008113 [Pleurodeles waltl]